MIRIATKDDIDAILRLLRQVLLVHHKGRPDLFKEVGEKYGREELEEILNDDKQAVFVYEEKGKVLGHCFCKLLKREESGAAYAVNTLFIDDLCIDEEVRGNHIGTQMYEFVKAWAKDHGFNNITLHVWECNPKAVAFYKKLGMKVQQYTMEERLQ